MANFETFSLKLQNGPRLLIFGFGFLLFGLLSFVLITLKDSEPIETSSPTTTQAFSDPLLANGPQRGLPPLTTISQPTLTTATQDAEAVPTVESTECRNPISIKPPGNDLSSQVQQSPEGSCFRLDPGTYTFDEIKPKNEMIFEGVDRQRVIVDGSGKKHAFLGAATGVEIRKMQFRNFDALDNGNRAQELAPILGKPQLWDKENRAKGWLIEEIDSYDNVASGLHVGDNFIVRNSRFYGNGITGISGDRFKGGEIYGNEIYSNGVNGAEGQLVNNGGIKITWADDPENKFIIRDNYVYENTGPGIWCDLDCNNVLISNNTVRDSKKVTGEPQAGIFYELSRNAVISGNTLSNSTDSTNRTGTCVYVGSSQDVIVENNILDDCKSAMGIKEEKRPGNGETYLQKPEIEKEIVNWFSARVTFRNNTVQKGGIVGIFPANDKGNYSDYGSIKFENNDYEQPSNTRFVWGNEKLSFDEWKSNQRQ